MNVNKILIIAVILSGGICGIAGMMQASGSNIRLLTSFQRDLIHRGYHRLACSS